MDNTALVTGGSGGLGAAVVAALRAAGWVVHAPSHAECNVEDPDAVLAYAARLDGDLDALVLAHAAPAVGNLAAVLRVDVMGAYNMVAAFVPRMVRRAAGRVVLFSSIRAAHPRSSQVAYATGKGAIESMARALAVRYGRAGVAVNCVAPGAVRTPRTDANISAGRVSESELVARTPLGRLATPDDVARVVVHLCEPTFISGQVVTVDGGWSRSG